MGSRYSSRKIIYLALGAGVSLHEGITHALNPVPIQNCGAKLRRVGANLEGRMIKWEYKTYRFHDGGMGSGKSRLEELFDKFGADGWELIQIVASSDPTDCTHRLAILKRPKPSPKAKRIVG